MPGNWDRRERALLAQHLCPGAVFVDVGCNFGGYTWWVLKQLGRDCKVVALEPDPELYARLRFNLDTNDWDHVRLFPYAAGGENGTASLRIHGRNRGENSLLLVDGAEVETVKVPLRTLASVLEEAGVEHVDALKMDIEGFEPPVLRSFFDEAHPSLWPGVLVCERKDTPEHDALEVFVRGKGYTVALRTGTNMVLVRSD